jgi:hypothetical protein
MGGASKPYQPSRRERTSVVAETGPSSRQGATDPRDHHEGSVSDRRNPDGTRGNGR